MKKVFLFALATAMMSFAGCQQMEQEAPVNPNEGGSTFEFVADIAHTKTTLDVANGYKVDWEEGDLIYMVTSDGTWGKPYNDDKNAETIAEFTYAESKFTSEATIADGEYIFKGMYAAASQKSFHRGASSTHKLEATQAQDCANPTAHIKANDALVGTFTATVPMTEMAKMNMSHLYTLMQVNVKNNTGAGIEVSKFEMTAEGADLAGIFNVTSFETPSITAKEGEAATETITVNVTGGAVDAGNALPIYFVMAPLANYSGNVTFKVTDSKGNTYSKTVTMSGISFEAGKYNTTPYAISVADEVVAPDQPGEGAPYYEKVTSAPVDWSGKYLIVYETGENAYVFNGKDEVNGYVAAKISDNKIASTSEIDAVAVTIEPMSGGYAIKTSAGYIYGNSSSNKLSFDSSQKLNTIEYSSTNDVTITSGRVLRFNAASNQMRYRYYSSGTQQPIQLYRLAASNETPDLPDTTPAIVVSGETSKNVEFGGGEVTFNYELKNLDGEELTWEVSDEEMISSVSAEDGVLTVTVAENDGEARTATITLSCGDADDVVLILNQAEYVDASVIEEITVADFLSKSVDANVWYQLTGTIKEIKNTTYGNFYLEDETGYVYVYGLTKTQVSSNDKSFESIGLREGDTVTLIGTRAQYASASVADQKEQVGGPAYYVSHVVAPYVELTMESASVDAETTSYTVDIKSNSNWIASASTDVTLDKTSGNGDASIKMTFTENTTSDAVTHTLTVEVEGSTKTFTLTQKGVVSGGDNEPVVVFAESFSKSTGTMGWSDNAGNGTFATDNTGWTVENAYGAGGSAKFGTSKKLGKATTPALNITGNATLKFKAGAWTGDQTNLKLSMSGGTLSVTSVTMKDATWTEYEVTITNATSGAKVTFEGKQASKARFFLDDIEIIQN